MLDDNTYDDGTDLDDASHDDDNGPLYPDIHVELTGLDGNAFAVIGRCLAACKRGDIDQSEVKRFQEEAMSGDYGHLLATTMKWFECS